MINNLIRAVVELGYKYESRTENSVIFHARYDGDARMLRLSMSKTKLKLITYFNKELLKEIDIRNLNTDNLLDVYRVVLNSFPRLSEL